MATARSRRHHSGHAPQKKRTLLAKCFLALAAVFVVVVVVVAIALPPRMALRAVVHTSKPCDAPCQQGLCEWHVAATRPPGSCSSAGCESTSSIHLEKFHQSTMATSVLGHVLLEPHGCCQPLTDGCGCVISYVLGPGVRGLSDAVVPGHRIEVHDHAINSARAHHHEE